MDRTGFVLCVAATLLVGAFLAGVAVIDAGAWHWLFSLFH
jgi:hypothetical protein